ncbi:hypothetical protein [Arcticibacterium luteifluviistationis]|nr:hypothetical protein [Arcticibacterium luteifluviistationis]
MRNVFKKSPATLAQFTTSSFENGNYAIEKQTSPGWRIIVYHNYAIPGMKISLSGGLAENESLEILDVKEVYQAPVFPCLDSTAFIVTFRFKAKTFGQPKMVQMRL